MDISAYLAYRRLMGEISKYAKSGNPDDAALKLLAIKQRRDDGLPPIFRKQFPFNLDDI